MTQLRFRSDRPRPGAGVYVVTASVAGALLATLSACTAPAGQTPSPSPVATRTPDRPAPPTVTRAPSATVSAHPSGKPPPTPAPLIVIDPGHSGRAIRGRADNGLRDIDYPNFPEIYEMFDVSTCVAKALRADGYRVLLTKKTAMGSVSHRDRAAVANKHRAALAISVHDDHGATARFQHTYDQRGISTSDGDYPVMYRGTGSRRTVFDRPAVAKQSQRYARIIAAARSKSQGHRATVTQNAFDGRAPLEPGNLALVQLFSEVPWVYNEMGALTDGDPTRAMSISSETRYAEGLLRGVEAAVPLQAGRDKGTPDSVSGLRPCLIAQVKPPNEELTRPKKYLPDGFGREGRSQSADSPM